MLDSSKEEAFRCGCISLRRQQKVNRLAGGVNSAVQVSIFVFNLYVGLVYAVGFVRPPQMRATALVDLWRIRLDPPPNAAGIHLKASFRQHLGHVKVRERISEG
jgi:hypothetical protein